MEGHFRQLLLKGCKRQYIDSWASNAVNKRTGTAERKQLLITLRKGVIGQGVIC